jgi:hypothetical protein
MVRKWLLIGYFPILYNRRAVSQSTQLGRVSTPADPNIPPEEMMSQPQPHRTVSDNTVI